MIWTDSYMIRVDDIVTAIKVYQKYSKDKQPENVIIPIELAKYVAYLLEKYVPKEELEKSCSQEIKNKSFEVFKVDPFDEDEYQKEKEKSQRITYCRICGRGYYDKNEAKICARSHTFANERGRK